MMQKVINKLNLNKNDYFNFNDIFLKINHDIKGNKNGKLIVVTSTNPTPSGEGKTSLLIGLVDAMNYHNHFTIGCLRQPSLGPVFGLKGTASGGKESRLAHDDLINIHFTGDFHAITTANNLISSVIENEIYFNTNLDIDVNKILWKRCEDLNDRSLRQITINIDKNNHYQTGFNITAASDLMMLFCLANDINDFKQKLENTIIAFSKNNKPVTIKDLEISDAILEILKQALKVNLGNTIHDSLMFIHGGPFANIAHGCNSIFATKQALTFGDYVFSECGFGSDLGFEKFMNIKMQTMNKFPDLVVICSTIKSLIYHGQKDVDNNALEQLKAGFKNLLAHVNHVRSYGLEPLVVLNVFEHDEPSSIELFKTLCNENKLNFNVSRIYLNGPKEDTKALVSQIVDLTNKSSTPHYLYDVNKDSLETKLNKIIKNTYSLDGFEATEKVKDILSNNKYQDYYLCIAKTPYSLSSDPTDLNIPNSKNLIISDYEINYAAKTVVLICDKIFRMPGLNKEPRAKNFKF